MTAFDAFVAGPAGPWLAIAAMALTTYACRVSGVMLMSRFRVTPRVESALKALPGSIVVATVLPIALRSGITAIAGLAVGVLVMKFTRQEAFALVAGLAVVSLLRAGGL